MKKSVLLIEMLKRPQVSGRSLCFYLDYKDVKVLDATKKYLVEVWEYESSKP